jgi:predicted GNAT family N-acyltransferase
MRVGTSSIGFASGIFRGDALLVGAELVYVFADPHAQTSRPVPAPLRDLLLGFEAGEPVVDVRTGDWATLGGDAQAIRTAVFVQEQQIPADLEWDAADAQALHAVAYNRLGQALATGRVVAHSPGAVKIGRMAVSRTVRSSGVGRHVLDALIAAALARGEREVLLHAQTSAESFYRRAGFQPRGEVFEEAGIAHIEMVRTLSR